ncbi:uncharacterized protein LOC128392615 [Panonychus citri]|uniref:uncharacterized protein LOC128392615 n=1 Tax=Panonychus citri TaxID=50023 RepID=UPI0023077B46|nr:uncharacterized protein LOC128392615 [Panonychus citri]
MSKSIVKRALQLTDSDDESQPKSTAKKSTLEEYRKKQSKKVDENAVKQLEKLRSIKVDRSLTDKILKKRKELHGKKDPEKKPQPEKSFFTEDDFKRYIRSIF